ncbi:metal ABC transporter substrate-binding protein [Saccharopolyspora sp. HNM0983]|uniref:Lipoprotein n=1 Tax=Saccharopolyspora montiporae TaxID=2781240 RepID=A0A929FYW6_9PSEU|nr:MetQ/NlpA family ABC transporter substrate-binding protein [Saccharopolyspora sp. HNM0983]MBE9373910.1 metal ABC transporter substrate-binding protein [Saccharopolyspora sp. HNM0983]
MRKRFAVVLAAAGLALAGCGGGATDAAQDPEAPLTIGVSPTPHGEILEYVQDNLAAQAGIELELEQFDDYNRPNEAVANGELDANFFQHKPYLQEYQQERGGEFTWVESVHLEPLAVYSTKHRSLQEIPDGGTVMLSNDPANQFRGLQLLADNGLIELKPDASPDTRVDAAIAQNPKNIEFQPIAPDQLPRSVEDADASVVNGNYALKANLSDPLVAEEAEGNPYANGLVANPAMAEDPRMVKLAELLKSDEVKKFIQDEWRGVAVVPAD